MSSWEERQRIARVGEKRCSKCLQVLPLDAFVANRGAFLGVSSWCRDCHREATREWRERNRERVNAERREAYRAAHPLPADRRCVECGGPMGVRKAHALVCSERCRRLRKARRDRSRRG